MTGKRIFVGFGVVTLAVALGFNGWAVADSHRPAAAIGKPAPDFVLKDAFGKEHSLSENKGQIVVLEWLNQKCPFVVNHHQKLKTTQSAYAKFAGKSVVFLGIDSTSGRTPEQNRIWAAKHRLAYPILHDPTGRVGRLYGAKTTPHIFVIDEKGLLAYSGAIDDQKGHSHLSTTVDALLAGASPPKSETRPYGCSVKYAKRTAKATAGGNGGNGGKAPAGCCPALSAKAAAKSASCCGSADCPPAGCGVGAKTAKATSGGNGGNGGCAAGAKAKASACCPAR